MTEFRIRAYTKKELALMYFPDSMPHTAVNRLMGWVKRNSELREQLQKMGYQQTCKTFTPKQVRMIVDILGEP